MKFQKDSLIHKDERVELEILVRGYSEVSVTAPNQKHKSVSSFHFHGYTRGFSSNRLEGRSWSLHPEMGAETLECEKWELGAGSSGSWESWELGAGSSSRSSGSWERWEVGAGCWVQL